MTRTEIENRIDEIVRLADRLACKQIDAAGTRNSWDFKQAREAEDKLAEARDKLINDLESEMNYEKVLR